MLEKRSTQDLEEDADETGAAGEFVFDQLSVHILTDLDSLCKPTSSCRGGNCLNRAERLGGRGEEEAASAACLFSLVQRERACVSECLLLKLLMLLLAAKLTLARRLILVLCCVVVLRCLT